MTDDARLLLRALAVATLVALGGAFFSLLLVFAFPTFGVSESDRCYFCFTPLAIPVPLLILAALALAFATSISGLRHSQRARRPRWVGAFSVVLLLIPVGPTYCICATFLLDSGGTPIPIFLDPRIWLVMIGGAVAVAALTAGCALAYASRAISPNGPLRAEDDCGRGDP
jgi:hypothetical protein